MEQTLKQLTCQRCGHAWFPRRLELPKFCPRCNSPYWDKPRKRQYITLDPQGQLASGHDWDALMDEGQREMEQALARDKAREEEAQREFEAAMKGSEWEGI